MERTYDFSGWATRNDLKCADGRIIRKDAFKHNDGMSVPLVWNHQHNEAYNVLGHADLENRPEGVYAYCTFNETEYGQNARELVKHGDITALSIYANQLRQEGNNVIHGAIREVSLVLAGANPGARIDTILEHSDDEDEEAIIETVMAEGLDLTHSEVKMNETETKEPVIEHANEPKEEPKEEPKMAEKTVKDVFDTLNEEQKNVVYAIIGQALEDAGAGSEEDEKMKHNVFDSDKNSTEVLSHSELNAAVGDLKRYGSMKEAFIAHGIENIGELFPSDHVMDNTPQWIKRDTGWVTKVMGRVHHTPFSRIKSIFADITETDARAKGYLADHTHRDLKGNLVDAEGNPAYKKEEVFSLLKRTTSPTTVYKKQKFDRDDLVDITDFAFVPWIKSEMRMMLDEELARAYLVGDGRTSDSDDKINEQNIRPIWTDAPLFTVKKDVEVTSNDTPEQKAKKFIKAAIKSRKNYKGSGNPVLFTTEDVLTDCLLIEDLNGRVIYDTEEKLRTALRVSEIVTVPVMENLTRTRGSTETHNGETVTLMGIIVNLADYNVGCDKGGEVNMFDDFDIDYNAQKYLIETRCSAALTKPYSAIALEEVTVNP